MGLGCGNELTVSMNCFHRNDLAPSLVTTCSFQTGADKFIDTSHVILANHVTSTSSVVDRIYKKKFTPSAFKCYANELVRCVFCLLKFFPALFECWPLPATSEAATACAPSAVLRGWRQPPRHPNNGPRTPLRIFKCFEIKFPFFLRKRNVDVDLISFILTIIFLRN